MVSGAATADTTAEMATETDITVMEMETETDIMVMVKAAVDSEVTEMTPSL